jgi:Zn-dependent protease with chaperone function
MKVVDGGTDQVDSGRPDGSDGSDGPDGPDGPPEAWAPVLGTVCPICHFAMPLHERFSVWCPSCHWNLRAPKRYVYPSLYKMHRLAIKRGDRLHDRLVADPLFVARSRIGPALIVAVLIQLAMLTVFVASIFFLVRTELAVVRIISVVTAGLAAWALPRRHNLEDDEKPLSRDEVPHLFELVDEVTSHAGFRRIHSIVINGSFNASMQNTWRGPVLTIGASAAFSLTANEFVALVAHEVGHLERRQSWARTLTSSGFVFLANLVEYLASGGFIRKAFAGPVYLLTLAYTSRC